MARLNQTRREMQPPLPAVKPCDVFDLIGGTSTGGFVLTIRPRSVVLY
jgi:patatin-like phospholipase/acyl hydrolase